MKGKGPAFLRSVNQMFDRAVAAGRLFHLVVDVPRLSLAGSSAGRIDWRDAAGWCAEQRRWRHR